MRIVLSAHNVVNYPEGGGHFWVYLQYAQGLRDVGCDVWWLEEFRVSRDDRRDAARMKTLTQRLERYGLGGRVIFYTKAGRFLNVSAATARQVFETSDLLLNFHQTIERWMLEEFPCTALVDIDPGLLQYWMSAGVLTVPQHDLYFTTGETVGTPLATFPDCGLRWTHLRPPVSLELWPCVAAPAAGAFTTVSGWWGDDEWVEYDGEIYDNNKRASFLQFVELPRRAAVPLELALFLDPQSPHDDHDRALLVENGWSVRHSRDVAGSPDDYQTYIQQSLGEFSCAKASCMRFRNAWVSDRTLCYLATGRPVVVQDTGPSEVLPSGLGMFRFSTIDQAATALAEIRSDYGKHARAARELAERFDARLAAEVIVRRCRDRLVTVAP